MLRLIIGIFSFTLLLNACSTFHNSSDDQYARCKEIKRQIVFSGATSNSAEAQQERAGIDKLNQAYRDENCS